MSIQAMVRVFSLDVDANLKWILMCIADNANPFGEGAWPSVSTLVTKSSMSERTVQRCLAELSEIGLIKRVKSSRSPTGQEIKLCFMGEFQARPRANTANCPPGLRGKLVEVFEAVCQYCGGEGDGENGPDGRTWNVDRILPGSRGGSYAPENITLSCSTCNIKKKDKEALSPPDSLASRGVKLAPLTDSGVSDWPPEWCQDDTPGVPNSTESGVKLAPESSLTVLEPFFNPNEEEKNSLRDLEEAQSSQDQKEGNFHDFKIKFRHLTGKSVVKRAEAENNFHKLCREYGEDVILDALEKWAESKGGKKGLKNYHIASMFFFEECEEVIEASRIVEEKKDFVYVDPSAPKPGDEESRKWMLERIKKNG
jgi:5-methylcytosine-specific restriction endonuclease McrA